MSKTWLRLIIVLISLGIGSCAPSSNNETADIPIPPPAEQPQPEAQPEAEIVEETSQRVAVSGLTPPTNPETRVEGIARGVSNPFASIAPTPVVTITEDQIPTEGGDVSNLPEPPPDGVLPPEGKQTPTTEGETEPNLELARSVVVSGIVTLGDTVQIILTAPRENFSRYVELGQYVSNGEVLVKRIEEGDNKNMFVIFEQSGVEVRRPVGNTEPSTSS